VPLLHIGHSFGWGAWHIEPTIIGGALIVIGLYVYGIDRLRKADPAYEVPWRQIGLFAAGSAVIFLSLSSPLDTGADRLLSLHMLQHVGLTAFGPPLVLLGLPRELIDLALRPRWLDRIVSVLTMPYIAAALFIVNMWLWHIPAVYETALTEVPVHAFMHIAFMATGLLFWWPVIQPRGATGSEVARLLYVFATGFPMGILALILLASPVLYDYYETGPRLWGVSAMADQQIAGVIMGALGESASFIAFSYLFFRLMSQENSPPAPRPALGRPESP
jgi:cytochrome c oxidase assembly factor CtaG